MGEPYPSTVGKVFDACSMTGSSKSAAQSGSESWHALCPTVGNLAESRATIERLNGPVAQLVEQRIENPRVGSSILPQATKRESPSVRTGAFLFLDHLLLKTIYSPHSPPMPRWRVAQIQRARL